MPKFNETKILKYTARQLYDLVLDVEKYPEFVPWCKGCKIISNNEDGILAELSVRFGPFEKSYISCITHGVEDDCYYINVHQVSGPFNILETNWIFKKYNKFATELSFDINFEFKSAMVNSLIGNIFNKASKDMVEAFETRATSIYE